jgi:hypothetical protein
MAALTAAYGTSALSAQTDLARGLGQSRTPELLQIVKMTHFAFEQMHDHVAGIDQHPIGLTGTLGAQPLEPPELEAIEQVLGHTRDVPLGAAGRDDHEVGKAGLAGEIAGLWVDRLVVGERRFDEA